MNVRNGSNADTNCGILSAMLMRAALYVTLTAWAVLGDVGESSARSAPIIVYFPHDSAELDSRALAIISCAAGALAENSLIVSAYADRSGPADYNLRLSERRAMAVRAELIRLGVRPEHLTPRAFGETRLAVETPDGVRGRSTDMSGFTSTVMWVRSQIGAPLAELRPIRRRWATGEAA